MAKVNDGGPAFARGGCEWSEDHGDGAFAQDGMSLRDYFAAKALQGIISKTAVDDTSYPAIQNITAIRAYQYADVMLKQREVRLQS